MAEASAAKLYLNLVLRRRLALPVLVVLVVGRLVLIVWQEGIREGLDRLRWILLFLKMFKVVIQCFAIVIVELIGVDLVTVPNPSVERLRVVCLEAVFWIHGIIFMVMHKVGQLIVFLNLSKGSGGNVAAGHASIVTRIFLELAILLTALTTARRTKAQTSARAWRYRPNAMKADRLAQIGWHAVPTLP
jgi:hypothetical protein